MKNTIEKILFLFLFIFWAIGILQSSDTLIFIIRVDDILNRNMDVLPRSIRPFEQMAEDHGAKVTWGVIPHRLIESANQDGVLIEELKSSILSGHEVSQHGYTHICQLCGQSNHEMFCSTYNTPFTYEEQQELITNGLYILIDSIGIQPTSFIPPGHKADTTTFHVLLDQGFKWISTAEPTKQFVYGNLYNLAAHNEFTWALSSSDYTQRLQLALQDIKTNGELDRYYCILLHDHFVRQGYNNGIVIQWTSELLDSLIAYYEDKIRFMTLSEACQYFKKDEVSIANRKLPYINQFLLCQNYPNPFNPSSTISYRISKTTLTKINIYNLFGQEVKTLVNKEQQSGEYKIIWDGTDNSGRMLSSGVYIYQLQAGDFLQTKKMVLIK